MKRENRLVSSYTHQSKRVSPVHFRPTCMVHDTYTYEFDEVTEEEVLANIDEMPLGEIFKYEVEELHYEMVGAKTKRHSCCSGFSQSIPFVWKHQLHKKLRHEDISSIKDGVSYGIALHTEQEWESPLRDTTYGWSATQSLSENAALSALAASLHAEEQKQENNYSSVAEHLWDVSCDEDEDFYEEDPDITLYRRELMDSVTDEDIAEYLREQEEKEWMLSHPSVAETEELIERLEDCDAECMLQNEIFPEGEEESRILTRPHYDGDGLCEDGGVTAVIGVIAASIIAAIIFIACA